MSLEKALKALESLGLTELDAQVYAYLEKKGPYAEKELSKALEIAENQLRLSLRKLMNKEMITSVNVCSPKYYAIPLEKVLERFLERAVEEVKDLEAKRQSILETWHSANAQKQ